MANTFNAIWRELVFYNPDVPPRLVQSLTKDAFQELRDAKLWSWAVSETDFSTIASVSGGTIAVTNGSTAITGTGTTFVAAHVGEQIKISNRVFTIATRTSDTAITIDRNWPATTASGLGYTVLTAYLTVPTDFYGFVSVIDVDIPAKLWTNFDVRHIDFQDPQRVESGDPRLLADLKWSADATPAPMFELWPHQTGVKGLRALYWKIHPDFSKSQALPYTIPDRVIKQYVKSELADWPGTIERPNPLYSRLRSAEFRAKYDVTLADLMIQDDDIFNTDFWVDTPMTPMSDKFLREHDVNPNF